MIPDGGIGTLAWSAPEVRAGTGWTDKSDVYSMAHLLFRLLTGKVPVKGADPPTDPGSSGLASAIMRGRSALARSVARAWPSSPSCWRRR